MLTQQLMTHLADVALAAPSAPPAQPSSTIVDTNAIIGFFASVIAPIIAAILGIVIMARARSGRVSESLTSSGVFILGIFFLGGAGVLVAFGDDLANLILQ